MAPTLNQVVELASRSAEELQKRYTYCNNGYYYNNGSCTGSAWYYWGRWVLAGIVIVVFILIMLSLGCLNSRRRRRAGLRPRYGTAWMAPPPKYENTPNAYSNYGPPPPQYTQPETQPQYTGTTMNQADGYYGGNNNGYNPTPPTGTYHPAARGGETFEAPPGPPPAKVA